MNKDNIRRRKMIKRNKRRRQLRTISGVCFISLIVFTMFFAGVKLSAITADAESLDSGRSEKMFKSILIEKGDCLWDIADRYMGAGYTDKREYIDEIIDMNNLDGTEIHYGQYICIPYYG